MSSTLSICFVSLNAYGSVAGLNTGHVGGVERQQAIMTHWLARRGHNISLVTWDEGPEMLSQVDGIKIHKICKRTEGVKGLRFFFPRWFSLWRSLKEANADIYFYNIGDLLLGQIVLWTQLHGKKVVYSIASDPDCQASLPALKSMRERILYKYGLLHCDAIIAQTCKQQKLLEQDFALKSLQIPMPCEGFFDNEEVGQPKKISNPVRVLWVGRISQEKRLELLLECASRCKDVLFDVIGTANTKTSYSRELIQTAKSIKNVVLHGRVEHSQIGSFYDKATLFVNTSKYEGFPNTFLESWSVGLPVISMVDPDDCITKMKLGFVVDDVGSLVESIHFLCQNSKEYEAISRNAYTYFVENHTINAVMPIFESVFFRCARSGAENFK